MCVIGHDWESSSSDGGRWDGIRNTDNRHTHTHAQTKTANGKEKQKQSFPVQKEINKKKRVVSLNANRK